MVMLLESVRTTSTSFHCTVHSVQQIMPSFSSFVRFVDEWRCDDLVWIKFWIDKFTLGFHAYIQSFSQLTWPMKPRLRPCRKTDSNMITTKHSLSGRSLHDTWKFNPVLTSESSELRSSVGYPAATPDVHLCIASAASHEMKPLELIKNANL